MLHNTPFAFCVTSLFQNRRTRQPRSLQKSVSPDIGWIVGVLTAVDLHDQGMRGAREIDHEGTNWNLAAKLDAAQTAVAQQTPHDALRVGLIPAE